MDPCSNYLKWSADNNGIAVAGEDKIIRLYKAKSPTDFVTAMTLSCQLEGAHFEPINCVDISPNKTLLVSSANDSQACVYDLRSQKVLQKLTFRDKAFRDARGQPDNTNFTIRGCAFTKCGRYVYLLASKARYKTFLVKYGITTFGSGEVVMEPV